MVAEFNRGIYDYIVATDEDLEVQSQQRSEGEGGGGGGGEGDRGKRGTKRKRKDREYGVSRGIDFQGLWQWLFKNDYGSCALFDLSPYTL